MSEQVQVQVREGVWLTREGEEIEVRARDITGFETEWRWYGERNGHMVTWRDDGTIHIEREQREGDLVRFLRLLPEAEPQSEPAPEPEPVPEPQPVQVRAGIWKTRSGREVEVRERYSLTRFRWVGVLLGINESWRDDGQWSVKNETNHRDLVEYVGPLPQAEPEPAPEPQPVQVRPGIWLTREGHAVEVRENSGQLAKDFPWRGELFDVVEIWRNNGQWLNNATCDHRDLVEYVGPLPQQTATDTLAEIEEQAVAEIEEALPVNPFEECRRLRAEVCRLQQAHQAMTEHARELLESGQQARDQRDLLAQQLVTKPSEEALQKEVSRKQIEINTLQDRLEHMTTDRETLRRQFAAMTADRDRLQAELARETESLQNERFQAQTAHAGRKRAEEHLETVTVEAQRLEKTVTPELQRLASEVQRLQAELRQAQIDLDAERETPASNCRAVVDAHLIGAKSGRQAAFEAVERWVEVLAGVDSEHAAAILQALPGCIRKLAELEGATW